EPLPGFYHAVFHEKERQIVVTRARQFIQECFASPPQRPALLDADTRGFTRDEFDRLRQPGSPLFSIMRCAMKTLGRLSKGIQLGWSAGFDSGRTLDYVYENKAQGWTPLGRVMDRSYLDSIGWRGIRVRKANLQKLLREAIEKVH